MGHDEYDPGTPHDPPPYRRRRQRRDEIDDGWAAADEDDYYDDGVEIEDLAAGYVDHEQREQRRRHTESTERDHIPDPDVDPGSSGWTDDDRWSPSVERVRERGRLGSQAHRRQRYGRDVGYDRADVYGRSPTYYLDRMRRGEYGEYRDKPKRGVSPYESSPGQGWGLTIPFWQIMIIVVLALFALLAAALACISVLML
jgi:hypothetical protein